MRRLFWLRPSALFCDTLRWRCYQTFCFWVVLWCEHAVPPFPSFGLIFLFHLACSLAALALAGAILFCLLFLSLLFLSFVPVLCPLAASMVAILWSWGSLQVSSFLPFRLDPSGLGVRVSSQSLKLSLWVFLDPFLLCSQASVAFGLTSSSYFSWGLLRPPSVRCAPQDLSFFCLYVWRYSVGLWDSFSRVAFLVLVKFGGLSCAFSFLCWCGVWGLLSSVLRLKAVDFSLGSGKFRSPFFVCGRSLFAPFLSSSTLCVWLKQNFGVSSFRIRALVVCRLSFSWDFVLVLRQLVSSMSEPVVSVSLWALGRRLCSVFLSSACGLLFFRPSRRQWLRVETFW